MIFKMHISGLYKHLIIYLILFNIKLSESYKKLIRNFLQLIKLTILIKIIPRPNFLQVIRKNV
jgi:hypothetical protein